MIMQLRERPSITVRFKYDGLHIRDLNHVGKVLRSVGTDEILPEIEHVDLKAPGVARICFGLREVSVPLTHGWFVFVTFKSTLQWWDNQNERKRRVRRIVRSLGLQPWTISFMGEAHRGYREIPELCQCTAGWTKV
jgi:hypothetical protein